MALDIEFEESEVRQGTQEWKRIVDAEVERRRSPKGWADTQFALSRFFVRLLRIAAGVAIGLGAVWLFSKAGDTLSKPFAALSPLELIWRLVLGFGGVVAAGAAFSSAFGEGESRSEYDARVEGELRHRVELMLTIEPWRIKALQRTAPPVQPTPLMRRAMVWFWIIYGTMAISTLAVITWWTHGP